MNDGVRPSEYWTREDWLEFKADLDAFRAKWKARSALRIAQARPVAPGTAEFRDGSGRTVGTIINLGSTT